MRTAELAIVLATALCLTASAATPDTAVLFADDFDAGTSASGWHDLGWGGDCAVDYAFDYSTRGIPSAPHSTGGTTVGLHMTVNAGDAVAAKDAVSAYPLGVTFSGDQTLVFDVWLNYCGGAGGGAGSTQHTLAGLHHAGDRVVWHDNTASDGLWCAVTGEGGSADDYCTYTGPTLQGLTQGVYAANSRNNTSSLYQELFPVPPFETVGAPGKQWVTVEIRRYGDVFEWRMKERLLTIRLATVPASGTIMLGQQDPYTSISSPAQDTFVVFDNVRVLGPDCNGNGTADQADLAAGTSLDCNGNGLIDDCETIGAGDFDNDGDVDAADLNAFGDAMAGPAAVPQPPDSRCVAAYRAAFDSNTDTAIDLADFSVHQRRNTPGLFAARAASAPLGSRFLAEVAGMTATARETRVQQEVAAGNVPGFLRTFVPVQVSATIDGVPTTAVYEVAPDYLSIGHNRDFMRMPLTPTMAQTIADSLGCLLPTRKMVNDIWAAAGVKLAPAPISPSIVDIMLATTFFRHHQMVEAQRAGYTLGPLIGGIKKDVVITPLLLSNPGKVAIYGWHYLNGTPIQPLYLGHGATYMDYSHGIRLVRNRIVVNGVEMTVAEVLAHPTLNVLLSDEGVVTNPRYPTAQ